ncbi:MAG: hypothetical protein M3N82_01365 [Pseudomonadota bacterium]|nr:hypothetical protein [Pseudomonadota bacterium]
MASVGFPVVLREAVRALPWNLRLWRWRLWHRYGVATVVLPLALAVLAALAVWDSVNQRRIAALEGQASAPLARSVLASTKDPDANRDEARRTRELMVAFESGLPGHGDVGDTLASIVKLAEARHLLLAHGEYREQLDDVGPFASNEMIFPVSGNASAVQGFISDVLHAQPYLALEHLRVQRSTTTPGTVDVQMRWMLFTRRPAGAHAEPFVPALPASGGLP